MLHGVTPGAFSIISKSLNLLVHSQEEGDQDPASEESIGKELVDLF